MSDAAPTKKVTSRKKTFFRLIGIALLGTFFYVGVWPFIIGGSQMASFCSSLPSGLPVAEIVELARQKGYHLSRLPKETQAVIHERRSMGRFLCQLELDEERLLSAKYQFND